MHSSLSKLAAIFLSLFIVGSFVIVPRPAQAQFGGLVTIVSDIPGLIKDVVDKALKTVVAVAYKSGLQYFLNRVAYDTANNLAFGCPGGKPCFQTKPWGEYLSGVGDEALGEFFTTGVDVAIDAATGYDKQLEECEKFCSAYGPNIDPTTGQKECLVYFDPVGGIVIGPGELSYSQFRDIYLACYEKNKQTLATQQKNQKTRDTLKSKVTLCSPISVDIYAKIELTARNIFNPPPPQCKFSDIRKNLPLASIRLNGRDIFRTDFSQLELRDLPEFAAYFNPAENDIGATLTLIAEGFRWQSESEKAKTQERQENRGYTSLQDPVTGQIKSPPALRAESYATAQEKGYAAYLTFTGDAVADAFHVFTNTLVSKFFQRIVQKGFNPATDPTYATFSPQSGIVQSIRGARLIFADILKTDFTTDTAVDLLVTLASDEPTNPESRVINEGFRIAIENKLTLYEATHSPDEADRPCPRCQKLISLQAPFGFAPSGAQPDWRTGIPYRSIVIMRKHRIVPVGWELAALYIRNFGKTHVTLGELMTAYDQCGQGGAQPSPYCRLVDPNWVLKAPLSHCYREGPGELNIATLTTPLCDTDTDGNGYIQCPPDIASPPIERQTVCPDQRSCIVEGGAEGCLAYGYCTKEKQVWSIAGEECPAQHASCLTVTKQGTDETYSFVVNTTDSEGCVRSASTGCRRYAKTYDATTGAWIDSLAPDTNYYLNQSALQAAELACRDAKAVGCSEYLRVRHKDTDLRPYTVAEYQTLLPQVISGAASYRDPVSRAVDVLYLNGQARSCAGPAGNPGQYVGCALYTPRDANALQVDIPAQPVRASVDPATNTITAWNDECPAECVGYRRFEQAATNFESGIALSPGVTMIPTTARLCAASDAGCDEFTNLDAVALGGEGREYYTELRQCQKPGAGSEATYYTWEGSDTTGFQLKVWQLVPSGGQTSAPKVTGPKLERIDPILGWDGIDCYEDYNSANPDLDCREFVDTALNRYYRYWSKTITVSDDCHPMRRTGYGDPTEQADCTATGGAWTGGACLYQAVPSEGIACNAVAAGCREYKGGDGGIAEIVFADSFEGGSYAPWTGTALAISNEAVISNTHSLRIGTDNLNVTFWQRIFPSAKAQSSSIADRSGLTLREGAAYLLTFWGRSAQASTGVSVSVLDEANNVISGGWGNVTLTDTWQPFTLGPFTVSGAHADARLRVSVGNGIIFLDNVILQSAHTYAVKNSWTTPASCDQDPPGTVLIGAHVGCAAYTEQGKEGTRTFRRFTNLCPAEFAGCEALVDTQNSSSPAAQTYYGGTASSVTVPADALSYIIPTEEAQCEANQVGCEALGQASLRYSSTAGEVAETRLVDTVVMVDPDTWSDQSNANTALCTLPEEYCAAWTASTGPASNYIFKDPSGITCEYATKGGVTTWYRTGTSQFCPTVAPTCSNAPYVGCAANSDCPTGGACRLQGHCIGGKSVSQTVLNGVIYADENLCESDADCVDFARPGSLGLCSNATAFCPDGFSSCTEYQDPRLPEDCERALQYGQRSCSASSALACTNDTDCQYVCSNNPTRTCRTAGDCGGAACNSVSYGVCSVPACDSYFLLKDTLSDALGACTEINPEIGCVGLHEEGGSADVYVTQKHCSATITQSCSVNADCPVGETCVVGSTQVNINAVY